MVHTVYTYEVYARECVCNFRGFSKKKPRLETPFVGRDCTLPNAHEARWFGLGNHITPHTVLRGKRCTWFKLISDTHRSPHIGSKLCYIRAPRGVG